MAPVSQLIEQAQELPVPPVETPVSSYVEHQRELTNDYDKAKIVMERIISSWNEEVDKTKERRLVRDVEIDVEELRSKGKLDADETIIPVRVIDTNIQREQPPYINYLKNGRRLGIFTCVSNPEQITTQLELEFTRVMSYTGWEIPHFKCLDGTQTHGWDAVEVEFVPSKPGKVGIDHVGHDMLFFPKKGKDIQESSEVIRAYDITLNRLKSFVEKFGFDAEQVGRIMFALKDKHEESDCIRVYKRYKKFEGAVYVSWFCLEHGVTDWLKKPEQLFLGIRTKQKKMVSSVDPTGMPIQQEVEEWVNSPVTIYPIFILPYRETEKPQIIDHKGRVHYDENKQEAQTACLSGFVNGITRASNIYGAASAEDGSGSSLTEVPTLKIIPGRIYNKPLTFWHTDYPDPMVLRALQYFDVSNSQETNQTNFAALNREDSRKTAKEIGAAQAEKAKLDSVQLTLFSTHIRNIYSFAWLIVQSQALQGKIQFLLTKISQPRINPFDGTPMMDPMGQPIVDEQWVNDDKVISQTYDVRAAGDVDVVQREEKIQQMQVDWPVVSTTVLAARFLADMMRLKYPDVGNEYAKILETQGNQFEMMKALVGQLSNVLNSMVLDNPQVLQQIPPDQALVLKQLIQQGAQISGATGQTQNEPS